jgi:hypothetical protein
MPYLIYKTNGKLLTTVNDSAVDVSTDLNLVGKNYAGYGLAIDENFVYLLENFANTASPPKPIIGQTWFDTTSGQSKLKVYDGASFKGIATIRIQNNNPINSVVGDLWWDTQNQLLKTFDGASYQIIGPSLSIKANWLPGDEYSGISSPAITVLRGSIGNKVVAVMSESDSGFFPYQSLDLDPNRFPYLARGITLSGANSINPSTGQVFDTALPLGSTRGSGYYFWGTAAESLTAVTATNVRITTGTVGPTYYVTMMSTATGVSSLVSDSGITYSLGVLNTVASSARFADLAERYAADEVYENGTVLVIGGSAEVTISKKRSDTAVAGVVSENPAYMMNSEAGNDQTHPYIALKGRVKCKIVGGILRGDRLVTSGIPGHACAYIQGTDDPTAIIGTALESFQGLSGVIEIKV